MFVSQHALAVHILSDHMHQKLVSGEGEDTEGQVVDISETIEIPIGEEMVVVQAMDPGMW